MRIKYIYFLVIFLVLASSNCNSHLNNSNIKDCSTLLREMNKSHDTSKAIDNYNKEVINQVSNINQKELLKIYTNCSKADLVQYYLSEHPLIDSVTISPSGHGISFFRRDDNKWANILIE